MREELKILLTAVLGELKEKVKDSRFTKKFKNKTEKDQN